MIKATTRLVWKNPYVLHDPENTEIMIKATTRLVWKNPYVLHDPENTCSYHVLGRWQVLGQKLVEEAMEAGNPKGTYLFYMLELLSGPHLESGKVERVLRHLGPLKEKEDMVWLRATTIRQFGLA
ncbi:hypothetical protein CJ030_MR5G009623 [Morella rubra]|uniref:Uncharacterized protein n=1 Tax=Morella rubra TaxID=262757 RepID=A0A6A1VK17_9ROSI|nr:hypothetical protein CJ030_MR5G009623 [Morella rubra]